MPEANLSLNLNQAFVGRESALRQLRLAFEHLLDGEGSVVLVNGEAGIGKTTLVEQFRTQIVSGYEVKPDSAKRTKSVRFAAAKCNEKISVGESYEVFRQVLDDIVRQSPRSYFDVLARLMPKAAEAVPWAGPILSETIEMAFEHIGIKRERKEMANEPSAVNYQYIELISEFAKVTPLVLFLDDLHWADESSMNLLLSLSRRVKDYSILLIGAYRPADVEPTAFDEPRPLKAVLYEIERYRSAEFMPLEHLNERAVKEYLSNTFEGLDNNPQFLDWFFAHTEGWPLAMSEISSWLVETGRIHRQDAMWEVDTGFDYAEVPPSIAHIVDGRVSRLDRELQRTLQYASIDGEAVQSRIVAFLMGIEHSQVLENLETLAHRYRFLRENESWQPGSTLPDWRFVHGLVRHAIYDDLSTSRRSALHEKAITAYQSIFSSNVDEFAGTLAQHCEASGHWKEAIEYRVHAAHRAYNLHTHEEGFFQSELALKALENPVIALDVSTQIEVLRINAGNRRVLLRDMYLALSRITQACELALIAEDAPRLVASIDIKFSILQDIGEDLYMSQIITDNYEQAWSLALGKELPLVMAYCFARHLRPRLHSAREQTLYQIGITIDYARRIADTIAEVFALRALATAKWVSQEYKESKQTHLAVLDMTSRIDPKEWEAKLNAFGFSHPLYLFRAHSLEYVGNICKFEREWDAAISYFLQSAQAGRVAGDLSLESGMLNVAAGTLCEIGKLSEAENTIQEALICGRRADNQQSLCLVLSKAITISLRQNDPMGAQDLLSGFEAASAGWNAPWIDDHIRKSHALIAFLNKDYATAKEKIGEAIGKFGKTELHRHVQRQWLVRALIDYRAGNVSQALDDVLELAKYREGKEWRGVLLAEAYLLISRIMQDQNQTAESQHYFALAKAILDEEKIERDLYNVESWIG